MRIVPMGVYSPRTGQLVDASELNRVFSYLADSVEDIGQKRYSKVVLPLSFVTSCSTGYSNLSPLETLTYRYTPVVDVVVEGCQLFGHLVTSSGVTVTVIQTSTGATPDGCVSPLVAVGVVSDVEVVQQVFSQQRWTMLAGVEYQFVLGGLSFTTARFDLNLNLSIDRWQGVPPAVVARGWTDADPADATLVLAQQAALAGAVSGFAAAPGRGLVTMVRHGISSSTASMLLRIELPRGEVARMTARITRVQCWAAMASTAGTFVSAGVFSGGGASLGSAVASVSGLTQAYADSGPLSVDMTGAAGTTVTGTSDYSLRIVCGNTTVCSKVFVVVTYEW